MTTAPSGGLPMKKDNSIRHEIMRNLLGALEVALFMPVARKRFGDTQDEAIRSFIVPILLFPLTIAVVQAFPKEQMADHSANMISLMYSLRMAGIWAIFFGTVYWITKGIDRKKYFFQFVIATNWLTVPATTVFIPVAWMLFAGIHSWEELYPFMVCLMLYTYAFTGFMAAYVLRIPWELAGFIVFLGMCINDTTLDILYWVGDKL